ncbi:hypothetical protein DDD63_08300 [Actinobaculum sp. 313]|nr:hypothetical protein DDD63_08300 [Actinobaculum sp. 313]
MQLWLRAAVVLGMLAMVTRGTWSPVVAIASYGGLAPTGSEGYVQRANPSGSDGYVRWLVL